MQLPMVSFPKQATLLARGPARLTNAYGHPPHAGMAATVELVCGRMDLQPKKRSLPASLVASTVREQDLPATLQAVANTRHTAAGFEKRARRLPASLVVEAAQEQQSLPELTLSSVRAVAPPSKLSGAMASNRLLFRVITLNVWLAARPSAMLHHLRMLTALVCSSLRCSAGSSTSGCHSSSTTGAGACWPRRHAWWAWTSSGTSHT